MTILPFDEINQLKDSLSVYFENGRIRSREDLDLLLDALEDLFLLSYATGVEATNLSLGSDIRPSVDDVDDTVNRRIAGETWRERVEGYFRDGGTPDDIARIIDTESHRDANEAALTAARRAGATQKTWATMLDDRVRETHDYLEAMTVPIDDDFYTYDGDHAPAPGQFSLAENNVGCRCVLIFS